MLKFHVGKTGNWIFFAWKCMKNSNWNHFNLIEKSANNTVLKNNILKKIEYNAPSVNEMFFIWLKEVKQTSFQGYLIFFFLETSNDTYYIYLHIFYALRAFFKNDN